MPLAEARKHHRKRLDRDEQTTIRQNRIARRCIAVGALLIIGWGWAARVRGDEGWLNYRHEYIWANAAILVALAPASLMMRLFGSKHKQIDEKSASPRLRG